MKNKFIIVIAIFLLMSCKNDDNVKNVVLEPDKNNWKNISYEEFKRQKNEQFFNSLIDTNSTSMEDIIRLTKPGQDRLDSLTAAMQLKLEIEKVESGYYEWLLENKEKK